MNSFSNTVEIQATPNRVWEVLREIEHWPEWTSTTTGVERLDQGPLAMGSRTRIRQPGLLPAVWTVTEWDEKTRSFTWVNRRPGVHATARHRIEASGNGSRATLSVEFSGLLGPLIARLTGAMTSRYIAIEANGLKARSEGGK